MGHGQEVEGTHARLMDDQSGKEVGGSMRKKPQAVPLVYHDADDDGVRAIAEQKKTYKTDTDS